MKKVLVFGITDNPGGMESVIMNYYRHIDRTKVQFEFLCNTQVVAHEEEISRLGGKIHRIPARRDGVRQFRQAVHSFFTEHMGYYDVFWFNTCSLANIDYLVEAKRVEIPCRIIHCHNAANGDSFLRGMLHRCNQKRAIRLATDYWTCSEQANEWFYGRDMTQYSSYQLIKNAIDVSKLIPNSEIRTKYRTSLGVEDKLVLGHVGRFHFQKNQKFLIPIMKELKTHGVNACLLLIGQGEDMEAVRAAAQENQVADMINFLGVRSDVDKILQAVDVFVFPSLFEGLSIALLEAQAAGLPCVASDTVSQESKLIPNVKFLSLDASPKQWADAILSFEKTSKQDYTQYFRKAGFDIKEEAKKMQQFFENAKNGNG